MPVGDFSQNPHAIDSAQIGVPEHSHPGESTSNGKAERAVQAVVDHIRTLKAAFEGHYNVRLGNSHPLFYWMVEHAAYLLSKYQLGTDGRTGWGRLHGREAREKICEFAECVM